MAVEFNEPVATVSSRPRKPASLLSRLAIKTGIVKTEEGAQTLFLILVVAAFVAAFFLFMSGSEGPPAPLPEKI